jgi:lipopolysaccharide export system permease protein
MGLKKLSILLIKSFTGPFIVSFVIAIFVFEMQFVWLYMDDLMGKGLESWIILQLLFYFSARLVSLALPMAILMASIMSIGNLAENYELAAMKSAGLSLMKILKPLIFFITALSIGAFLFANNVWPIANLKFRTLLHSVVNQKPAINIEEGVFYNGIPGVSMRVSRKNTETGELSDVLIYDHRSKKGNKTVIHAERGTMQQTEDKRFLIFTLFNGRSYDEQDEPNRKKDKQYPHVRNTFERDVLRVDLSALMFEKEDEAHFSKAYEMMTIAQLDVVVDSIDVRVQDRRDDIVRFVRKSMFITRDSTEMDSARLALLRPKIAESGTGEVQKPTTISQKEVVRNRSDSSRFYFDQLSNPTQARVYDVARKITRQQHDYISRALDDVHARTKAKKNHLIEWHRKFFFAFACLVLFFIGAPLGAIIRKGGIGMPAVTAFGAFILYHIITMIGEKMAKAGTVDPWLGMWLSTLILLPVGAFLTYKATKDSAVMDKDFYLKLFRPIVGLFTRKKKIIEDSAALS